MLQHGNFDTFIKGKGSIYTKFWHARKEDLEDLPQSESDALHEYLYEQVFGMDREDDEEEYERQRAFNEARLRGLQTKAARKGGNGGNSGGQETDEAENEGEADSNKGEDKGEGSSHGK